MFHSPFRPPALMAMRSRGFRGEVHLLDDFRARGRDLVALACFVAAAGAAFWFGR